MDTRMKSQSNMKLEDKASGSDSRENNIIVPPSKHLIDNVNNVENVDNGNKNSLQNKLAAYVDMTNKYDNDINNNNIGLQLPSQPSVDNDNDNINTAIGTKNGENDSMEESLVLLKFLKEKI